MKKLAVVSLFALSMGVSVAFSNAALQDSDIAILFSKDIDTSKIAIAILFSKDIDTSKIALLSQQEMQETKGEFWSFLIKGGIMWGIRYTAWGAYNQRFPINGKRLALVVL